MYFAERLETNLSIRDGSSGVWLGLGHIGDYIDLVCLMIPLRHLLRMRNQCVVQ